MKKNSNIRFLLALPAACFLLAACTGDDALPTGYNPAEGEGNAIRFTATIDGDAPGTRIQIDELNGKGRFTAGDEIGILTQSVGVIKELAATYSNGIWTANTSWDILGPYSVDFHAFFPKVDQLLSKIKEVPTDQSTLAAYTNADFLYANATGQQKSDNPVKLDFHHILARIRIILKKGSGLTDDEFAAATVVIRNVHTGYEVRLDGIISAVTDHTADIIPKESESTEQSAVGRIFYAVLPPQTLPGSGLRLTVTAAGRQHTFDSPMINTELRSGNEYQFPVRLNKSGT